MYVNELPAQNTDTESLWSYLENQTTIRMHFRKKNNVFTYKL